MDIEQPVDWHWIEVEAESTVVPMPKLVDEPIDLPSSESTISAPSTALAASVTQLPAERIDDLLVVSLIDRQVAVNPGGTVKLQARVLNNGSRPARFRLRCESELHEEWLDPFDQSMLLQPGEDSVMEISIRPPRTSAAVAGEYLLTLQASAPEYAGRSTQVNASVTLNPFRELSVGSVQMQNQTVNVFRRSVRLAVPVTNLGNVPIEVQLGGYEQGRHFLYRFAAETNPQSHLPTLTLQPGESTFVQALVRPMQRAWMGMQPQHLQPGLLFQIVEEKKVPRAAIFSLYDVPFFGIWTVAGLVAAAMLLIIGIIAAGVIAAGIWWVRQMPVQQPPIVQQVSAPPQPAQPVVVVVPMNSAPINNAPAMVVTTVAAAQPQPETNTNPQLVVNPPVSAPPSQELAILPSPTPEPVRNSATFNSQGAVALTAPLVVENYASGNNANSNDANSNVPIITADNISQPGAQAVPVISAPQSHPVAIQPAPVINQPRMTYAQMFQEVALRYDLNWRMLAAQAYIESGFDSLALGKDGDMGLMQILPKTWQEFAPQANVKDPFESYSNTLVAGAYLDYLRAKLGEKGYPQEQWMLVAYNWGPDRVLDFLASGGTWETLDAARRKYAEEILRITATIP